VRTVSDSSEKTELRELRMYLVVRGDLDMPVGKAMAQAGHAFCTALMNAMKDHPEVVAEYYKHNQPKIVVKCKNSEALRRAENECAHLVHYLVTDAGRTFFAEPTMTCMAIGPCYREDLPNFVQRMQLL